MTQNLDSGTSSPEPNLQTDGFALTNQSNPRVDIGLPVLNGERFIRRALESLLSQSYGNIRILLSDNGSVDATVDVAKQVIELDSRIQLYEGEKGSATDNFSFVLNESDSDFFMWAAYDDVWSPDFIQKGLQSLTSNCDYFSANWWVGDLVTMRGYSSVGHPLSFIQESSATHRLLRYLNLHHLSHKCNLVYSLFRTPQLKSLYRIQDIADDGALSALVVHTLIGRCSEEVMFWKQGFDWRAMNSASRFRLRVRTSMADFVNGSKSFEVAKRDSLQRMIRLFPQFEKALNWLYAEYRRWPKDETMQLHSDLSSLLKHTVSELK